MVQHVVVFWERKVPHPCVNACQDVCGKAFVCGSVAGEDQVELCAFCFAVHVVMDPVAFDKVLVCFFLRVAAGTRRRRMMGKLVESSECG